MEPRSRGGANTVAERIGDLAFVALLALVTVAAVAWVDDPAVRGFVSLPLLAVLPGYALLAFYSSRADAQTAADPLRRGAVVVGTSLVLSAAIGVGLALAPVPGTHLAVAASTATVTVALALVAAVRRYRRADAGPLGGGRRRGDPLPAGHRAVVALTAVLAVAVVAHAAVAPVPAGLTEFYLLVPTEDGPVATDDLAFEPGEPATYVLGIENRERTRENYSVVAQLQVVEDGAVIDQRELRRFSATLEPGGTWRARHTFEPVRTPRQLRVVYLLYRGPAPSDPIAADAYRTVDARSEVPTFCRLDGVNRRSVDVLCPNR